MLKHRNVEMPFDQAGQAVQSGIERQVLSLWKQRPSFLLPETVQPPSAEGALIEDPMDGGSEEAAAMKRNSLILRTAARIAVQFEKRFLGAANADSTHSKLVTDDSAPA